MRRRKKGADAGTYGSVKSILDNHLDPRPAQKRATDGTPRRSRR